MNTFELLERDKELSMLREALCADGGPTGQLLAIRGAAGMGKTRLVSAARELAGQCGLRVLSSRGSALERSFAFGIVRQLFEPVLRRSSPDELREILTGAATLALPLLESSPIESSVRPRQDERLSILHGLFWLVANLADREPLLIAVDDLHWSDTPSLEWLGYVLRRLEGLPIVVAAAFRPSEPGMDSILVSGLVSDPLSTTLLPRPLSVAATRRFAERILHTEPADEFCAACLEATGGNPLLLTELLNALAEEGVAPRADQTARVQEIGPAAVSRAVEQRLAHLPAEAQAFAQALAVLGDGAEAELIAALARIDQEGAANAAEMLARVDVIERQPAPAYVHALVRDAVYLQMPPGQRQEAHSRAAALLTERGAPARRAAAQLLLTPRAGSERVVATLREAAREARTRSAPANAAVYLSRALDEPPMPEERGALLFELGAVEALMRDPDAEVHLREALSVTTDAPTRAKIALTLARSLLWRNATTEAVSLLGQAIAGLTEQHGELRLRLEAEMAGIALSNPAMHAEVAERLSHVGDVPVQSAGGRMLLAYAAFGDTLRGENRARCIERAKQAMSGPEFLTEEASTSFLVVIQVLLYADQLDLVLRVMGEARSLAERRGSPGSYALASTGIARVLHDMGRLLEAEAEIDGVLEACPEDQPVARAYLATTLAHVLLKRGDLAAAERALAKGGFDRSSVPRSLLAANPLTVHGLLHLALGDWQAALADFMAIGDLLEPAGCRNPAVARWRSGAALALVHLGKRDEARILAEKELKLSRAWGAKTMIGRSLRALGLVEGGTRGLGLLEEAADALASSPAAYELLKTQVELGAALRRANQRSAARNLLRECLDRSERSGAGLLAEQARQELLATGARPRRVVLSGVESLTPSERRIATMARAGMTNREIAQSLFVTAKTVETHLAHVFTKLDIRSRTELATRLSA